MASLRASSGVSSPLDSCIWTPPVGETGSITLRRLIEDPKDVWRVWWKTATQLPYWMILTLAWYTDARILYYVFFRRHIHVQTPVRVWRYHGDRFRTCEHVFWSLLETMCVLSRQVCHALSTHFLCFLKIEQDHKYFNIRLVLIVSHCSSMPLPHFP